MPKFPSKGSYKVKTVFIDTNPTTYNTRFRPNALQQVSDTINSRGLPLLMVHDSQQLPVGAWYESEVNADEQVVAKFYVPQEISEYDDIKARVDTGILDSVSIGFNAGTHDCSICGNDIQNYEECPHIPGQVYEVKDTINGTSLGDRTCYVMLDDIDVKEGSLVYSGAVPAAKIIESSDKAEFFTKNSMNFAEGSLEVVHGGQFLQDNNEKENNGSLKMEKDLLEMTGKFNDAREANIALKEQAIDNKSKLDAYDDAVLAKDEAVAAKVTALADNDAQAETFAAKVQLLADKVAVLAVPFDANYKAPDDMEQLLKDLDTYLDKTRALPTGRQTKDEDDEATYQVPDSSYKV